MIRKHCKICNIEFFTKDLKRECCSPECSAKNIAGHNSTSVLDRKAQCKVCGKVFPTKWSKICPICRYDLKKKRIVENRRKKNPFYTCFQCHKVFPFDITKRKPKRCPSCAQYVIKKVYSITCVICKKISRVNHPKIKTCSPVCSRILCKRSNRKRHKRWLEKKCTPKLSFISQTLQKMEEIIYMQEKQMDQIGVS